jgi:alpha-glucosidase
MHTNDVTAKRRILADIDYMYKFRDFTTDPDTWSVEEGKKFLDRIHKGDQHFVPIVDAAIYAPDLDDPDDAYATFQRGVEAKAFMMNPDGSLYIGEVWPGFTGSCHAHIYGVDLVLCANHG